MCRITYILTFDDGPTIATDHILDILLRENIQAVFFFTGRETNALPRIAKRAFDEGHLVGNHSYTHADLIQMNREKVHLELSKTQEALAFATGKIPSLFRPPFGETNELVQGCASLLGLRTVLWTASTNDWSPSITGQICTDEIQYTIDSGTSVIDILLHSRKDTARGLPDFIEWLKEDNCTFRGYRF